MASINSVSFYSQLSARNKGIGGLATGLDTDALVEALTLSTRSRLAKQTQQKTLINWKMSAYRGVASTLRAFQTKHLSMAAGVNSLKANAFFNVYKGTTSSDKITVRAGGGSQTGSFTVDAIKQLAASQTFSTGQFQRELKNKEGTQVDQDYIGKTLQLSMNGTTKTIRLDTLQGKSHQGDHTSEFAQELQRLIDDAFGQDTIQVIHSLNETEGTFSLQLSGVAASTVVEVRNTADSLGLAAGMTNRLNLSTKLSEFLETDGNNLLGDTLKFSINDTVITVNRDDTIQTFLSRINSSSAGVTASFNSITESFVFTSKATGAGDNLKMRDVQGNLLNLFIGAQSGNFFASGISYDNASHTGSSLDIKSMLGLEAEEDLPDFSTEEGKELLGKLKNYKMKVSVGSTSLTVSADVSSYLDDIAAGNMDVGEAVLLSINTQMDQKFGEGAITLFFTNPDDPSSAVQLGTDIRDKAIKLETVQGAQNALEAMGLRSGQINKRFSIGYDSTVILDKDLVAQLEDGKTYKVDLTIGTETKTLSFEWKDIAPKEDEEEEDYQKRVQQALVGKLNLAKSLAFGNKGDATKVNFQLSEDGELTLVSTSEELGFTIATTPLDPEDEAESFFATETSIKNHSGGGTKLKEIGITLGQIEVKVGGSGGTVTFGEEDNLYDLMSKINEAVGRNVVTFQSGQLTLDAGTLDLEFRDVSGNVLATFFGQASYQTQAPNQDYHNALAAGKGQNAVIVVGGQEVVSTTNTFTVNGVDFEVNTVSKFDPISGENLDDPITVNVTTAPDDLVDKIRTFIEEYNVLIDALDSLVKEEQVSGYDPLTEEQKAEMTEEQIKSWEKEAKKGLLRNDATLRNILGQMRGILYEKVESAGVSLYDIGITTQSYNSVGYSNNGKLEMTEAGEKKLREMLNTNPDAVRELFTHSTDGFAAKLDGVIDNAVRTSSTNQGSLVALAGSEFSTGNNESTLSRQLSNVERQISLLQTRLENEYNRYWKRFSALETAIARMNTQSSWLLDFGS